MSDTPQHPHHDRHEGHLAFAEREHAREGVSHHERERPAVLEPRLLIVGPQGSGKGTQAARIAARFGIPAISTGDLFRANIAGGTELGTQVRQVIAGGHLVTDELTFALLRERLSEGDTGQGFLLDGFPRNLEQLGLLDGYLSPRDEALTAVIVLDVPREISIARLAERARLEGREDDTDEVIANRLEIYERATTPILEVYREHGLTEPIDGVGSLDAVTDRIVAALANRGIRPAA